MSRISTTLQQIAQAWPRDALRPTIQFSQVLVFLASSDSVKFRAVAAARALTENRGKNQFSLTEKMTIPSSSPDHYTRLLDGLEKSLNRGRRSWIERLFSL
ncbi:hypothetical protein BS47DRAFT_1341278 [Hydnum rufescens UP504]|uniref:Uncharacterized protein n=1 Tax=Hydnum rufescens UP504 TaxID=1448309 RepID=A0A9P6DYH8_9AGAM|nr:hypothetical protein BS47DRAFT_1341278 [Hydnum rufescens UP504]